ncbi:MAG: acriflavin resistance protein [Gemmatimonadetes bacterium]|nr:acriflavin resistance protein [Gemmatimonadota bacterium]
MNRAIEWFAHNAVAANLMMIFILAAGALSISTLKTEVFPEISSGFVSVGVPYPGATPAEVEESICVRIGEAVQGISGIDRLTSTAVENAGSVLIELIPGLEVREVLDDVKSAVDGITTFPENAEAPVVQEVRRLNQVVNVAISGPAEERALKQLGERVRDEIAALPGITLVKLTNVRPYEISIEVSEAALRRYGATFDEVAAAVRRSSLDLPAGSVKTEGGEVLVRTKGQVYHGEQFAELVVRTLSDGTRLRVADLARVVDAFAEGDLSSRFDGEPAVVIEVYRVGDQNALDVSSAVETYVEQARGRMPEGIDLTTWMDMAVVLRGRLGLLLRNGRWGIVLVFLSLALFLRPSLAFWVTMGIPISFMGALWLLPSTGVSINLLSLFAFIVVLGIVVDDTIVVGENVFTHRGQNKSALRAAIDGTREVATPVVFAVLTSIAAFSPLLRIEGTMGQLMRQIPSVVVLTLIFSLIESLFILPAHLAHLKKRKPNPTSKGPMHTWRRVQDSFQRLMDNLIQKAYGPTLERALGLRYAVVGLSLFLLFLTVGTIAGGRTKFTFFPSVEADNVVAGLTMPLGTSVERTSDAVKRLEESAEQVRREMEAAEGGAVYSHVLASIGSQPFKEQQGRHAPTSQRTSVDDSHLGEVNIQLVPSERRNTDAIDVVERWRERTGPIADAVELSFSSSLFSSGSPIDIQLSSRDLDVLTAAAGELKAHLATFPGLYDISDSFRAGKEEVRLSIRPEGQTLGLNLVDLARQVRQGFYGEEAQRIQRGRDEVKVMVRYPENERQSMGSLEEMRIRVPGGGEVPFATVARAEMSRAPATIRRVNRARSVQVTSEANLDLVNPNDVIEKLVSSYLPQLESRHPGLRYSLEGEQREQARTLASLGRGFVLAIVMIYALLAIPFRSYIQPLVVMTAIPFGLMGAIWGHWIMRSDLTILSLFGMVALTGVVVNDSLVLVDFINRKRRTGLPLGIAIRDAGKARFRPIVLTSLTTFLGLTPMLLERSLQARFLIPMATSLAFGVLFATFVTMIVVPVTYLIIEDIKGMVRTSRESATMIGASTDLSGKGTR